MASADAWERYERWNTAVAQTVYPENPAAGPAYLDLDDDVLKRIAESAGHVGDPKEGLRQAVRDVVLRDERLRLETLTSRRRQWMRDARARRQPPPVLAFLAITVLAAEAMGSEDSAFAKHAYYPQLAVALELAPDKSTLTDVQKHYAERAEDYWGALNWWLEECDGRRGLPTAYALSHRYVGLPLSQALVRDGDRKAFAGFFVRYGLAPGMEISGADLEGYLGEWFSLETCPVSKSLKRLWARESARARIADVVALELAGWDGTVDDALVGFESSLGSLRLIADLRRGFFGSALEFMLSTVDGNGADEDFVLEVRGADDEWRDVHFARANGNLRVLPLKGEIDVASLLAGVVEMRDPAAAEEAPKTRHPRATVPFVYDEMLQAFVERERIQLNTETVLLVRADGTRGDLVAAVETILGTHARPGWSKAIALEGVPASWVAFTGVQLFTAPLDTHINELVPLARDLLTVTGGIRIPSRIRKWATAAPPEIRVSLQSAHGFHVDVVALKGDETVRTWSAEDGLLVADLLHDPLPAGDYRVELVLDGAKDPIQQATLRLRSGRSDEGPDREVGSCHYVVGNGSAAVGVVGVQKSCVDRSAHVITGLDATEVFERELATPAPSTAPWVQRQDETRAKAAPVMIADPAPDSCVRTGAHHLVGYPVAFLGPKPKFIEGHCKYCGLVKRSPGWAKRAERKRSSTQAAVADLSVLPEVTKDISTLWAGALEAVHHLGAGGATDLAALATQIEPGAIFGGGFSATLESLGHIDVVRDQRGRVERWSLPDAQLGVRTDGTVAVAGRWAPDDRAWLDAVAAHVGASIVEERSSSAPPALSVAGLRDADLDAAVEHGICVVEDPCWYLLCALPALSEVGVGLARSPLPGYKSAERFDPRRAGWVQTQDVDRPGAYRLAKGFERIYAFRSEEDVERGEAACTTVHLVKHLAAAVEGVSLTVYLEAKGVVMVPLGCELPGLYGRAMVMASGSMPRGAIINKSRAKRKVLAYTQIDRPSADLLQTLLAN